MAQVKVKNTHHGIYADGTLYVVPGEVVEVSAEKADYLCGKDSPGSFERVAEPKPAAKPEPKK